MPNSSLEMNNKHNLEEFRILEWFILVRLFGVSQRSTTPSSVVRFLRQLLVSRYSSYGQPGVGLKLIEVRDGNPKHVFESVVQVVLELLIQGRVNTC